MRRCSRCGGENADQLVFCGECGNRLPASAAPGAGGTALSAGSGPLAPQPVATGPLPASPEQPLGGLGGLHCTSCGVENPRDARFCAECGTRVHFVSPPTTGGVAGPVEPLPPRPDWLCPRCHCPNPTGVERCRACGGHLGARERDSATLPNATGSDARVPRLVVIAQDGSPGREYALRGEQVDIGRLEGGIVLQDDPYVSPRHARLTVRDGRVLVRDLGSTNGVFVRLRRAHRLEHADLLLVGLEVLRFEFVSDAEQGLGPAEDQGTRVFGCPAAPRYARLCQRTVEGVTRDVYYVTRNQVVLGREHGDIVFSQDAFMSRRHAVLGRDPETRQFMLRDLGSSNGTFVAIRQEHELREGDHLRVGQHLFRLDVDRRTQPI